MNSRGSRRWGSQAASAPGFIPKREQYPYRLLLGVVPLHALQVFRYELAMIAVRIRNPRTDPRFRAGARVLVNVGCGSRGKPGWVNIDSAREPGVTCVYDCRRRIPLQSGCARAVFTEHLLEHLAYDEEVPVFLAECHRILEPGGLLRVVVPNGRKYLMAYVDGGWSALQSISALASDTYGHATPMEVVNAHFRQGGQHKFSYDFETLAHVLLSSGFTDAREHSFGDSCMAGLAIDNEMRASESLYVEAVRL